MIETKDLTKTFDNFTAVDSLNLKIEKGEFFGLLGPNGAGKTTTISLLSTLLLPTKGEILIDGQQLTDCTFAKLQQVTELQKFFCSLPDLLARHEIKPSLIIAKEKK